VSELGTEPNKPLPGPKIELPSLTFPEGARLGMSAVGRASGVGFSAGCLTVVLTLGALLLGLWLDGQFGTKPMFTLTLVLASIPLGLIFLVFYVLYLSRRVSRAIATDQQPQDKEP
jgi:MFS-type transporter involved in bile tolerance (Atg22 family)